MCDDKDQTKPKAAEFDFSAFPDNTLFYERRDGRDRRKDQAAAKQVEVKPPPAASEQRRAKKERRRRIDPTTFEKQYTPDELEFMNAMQRFKEASGKSFPTHGEVLKVAVGLGYRHLVSVSESGGEEIMTDEDCLAESSTIDALPDSTHEPIPSPTVAF